MLIRNGEKYVNNYARAAASFLGTCAPCPGDGARKAAYSLITGIYESIAEDAGALGYKTVDDLPFGAWEQQNGREKDVKAIRDPIAKIESLISELYRLTVTGQPTDNGLLLAPEVKPGRTLTKVLRYIGVLLDGNTLTMSGDCARGLSELAGISKNNIIPITDSPIEDKAYLYFSRCVFEPEENWIATAFDRLIGADGRLTAFCAGLEKRGYERIDCKDGKKISLDYVKQHGAKKEPVKMSWADKSHSGIEITFEELRLEPCFVWLRVPFFKTVLEQASGLPDAAVEFLGRNIKNCDGCRYCVQTDKTGTRPLAAVSLNGRKKCPYFPSFSLNWRSFPAELADGMLAVLDAVDAPGSFV